MNDTPEKPAAECEHKCPHCALGGDEPAPEAATYKGWQLAAMSLVVFVQPLALVIVGGLLAGRFGIEPSLGAVAGLAFGLATGWFEAKLLKRAFKDTK